jgi:hypothetical protein
MQPCGVLDDGSNRRTSLSFAPAETVLPSLLTRAEKRLNEAMEEHETFVSDLNEMLRVTDDVAAIKEWVVSHLPAHDFSIRQKLRQTSSAVSQSLAEAGTLEKSTDLYPAVQNSPTSAPPRQQSVMLNIQSQHVSSMNNLNNLLGHPQISGLDDDGMSERAASVGRFSRVGSMRAGSFYGGKKRGDGLSEMFGVENDSQNGGDGSVKVAEGLCDTYSLASKGSYRRRQTLHQVAEAAAGGLNIRRPRALSGNMDGMPALNLEGADLRTCFSRPTLRHTAVFTSDSDYEMMLDECSAPRIFDISSTEFNIFEEFLRYGNSAFAVIATNILLRYSFVQAFHFNLPNLMSFIRTVQSFYRSDNPFHNALHAADVMQTTHLYLCQRDVKENFSDMELFSLLFAAMVIDLGHLGVNNQFLVKTRHPISTLFSDNSPLEAMHAALAFCILEDPDCNFLSVSTVWDRDTDSDFRYLATNFIFNSDHLRHTELLENVKSILSRGKITDEHILELLSAILHAADMSYLSKPRHIFLEWSFRMLAENSRQGEAEVEFARKYVQEHGDVEVDPTARWLQISTICDKNKSIGTEIIHQMMELVVVPFLTIIRSVLPSVWIERMEANLNFLLDDEADKQQMIVSGVQDHLWRKGIAPTWNDVDAASGKNFLQVIRCWISTELPEEDVPSPSKIVAGQPRVMSSDQSNYSGGSQRPSNNPALLGEAGSFEHSTNEQGLPFAVVAPPSGSDQALFPGTVVPVKKRLSVSRVSTPGGSPAASLALNATHVLSSEMLRHMHTLVESNSSGAFDSAREAAIFATQWVKLLKELEEQEGGPVLLSSLAMQASRNTMSGSFSLAEEDDALMIVEMLRDLSSPVAHFKPQPAASSERRASFSDLLTTSSPFSVAVLLTQMWWILSATIEHKEDLVRNLDATPVDGVVDDDRSSPSASDDGRMASITIRHRTLEFVNQAATVGRVEDGGSLSSPVQKAGGLNNSPPALVLPPPVSALLHSGAPSISDAVDASPRIDLAEAGSPSTPLRVSQLSKTGVSGSPTGQVMAPAPAQPHAPAPHPSPLRYILQRKGAQARPSPHH